MLKIISLILLLGTSPVLAQIAPIQGHSFLGGTQAVTSGLKSSNYMQGIVPSATICVYNTGTTVPATIYANASGAPLSSCFTSNASISTDPGGWIFWAAINQGLDVVMSGGVSPNMYPAPVTISDLYPSTQITGCVFGTVCPISQGGTGATTAAGAVVNIVNGQVITPAAVTTATRTIDCAAYSTLALCWAAAQTYVTTNETGSGRAVRLLLHDQTYTISGSLAVYSGMQVVGVQPRLAANGSTIWQSPTPNGGTWINCGGGNCLTGGNSSGLTGVSLTNLGFTNFTNAMTFGGSGVNGLSNSVLTQIYFIGAAICCTADTGLVEYNGNFLQISGMYGYNVNTVFDFENASPVGMISGNSNIYDLYAYTYGKSAANGNNAKPGIKFGGGVNLVNVYRPQVNTYSGDNTGVGIEISASAMIHLFDTDTEGSLLHGIWLTNNSDDNTIELAIGAGTTDPNYIQIDSGSQYNTIRSSNQNSGFTLSGTALGFNFGYFPGFITDGDVGITFQDDYGAGTLFIGNGTLGDWSGTLNVANLAISQTGGTTYQQASGNLIMRATGSLGFGVYGSDLVFLQKDTVITADNAFEPGSGTVDLGGYNQGWAHGFFEHLDQAEAGLGNQYAGQCTVAATPATSCTITIQHAYTDGSLCFASPYSPYTGTGQAACNLSGTTITITTPVAIATTLSWNAFIVGNPF